MPADDERDHLEQVKPGAAGYGRIRYEVRLLITSVSQQAKSWGQDLEGCKEKGMEVNEAVDKAPFIEALQPVYERNTIPVWQCPDREDQRSKITEEAVRLGDEK